MTIFGITKLRGLFTAIKGRYLGTYFIAVIGADKEF